MNHRKLELSMKLNLALWNPSPSAGYPHQRSISIITLTSSPILACNIVTTTTSVIARVNVPHFMSSRCVCRSQRPLYTFHNDELWPLHLKLKCKGNCQWHTLFNAIHRLGESMHEATCLPLQCGLMWFSTIKEGCLRTLVQVNIEKSFHTYFV